jgi:hypothetical protein
MGGRVVVSLDGEILSEVQLSKPVTLVGRHPECDVVIEHPAVSARHMLFRMVNRTVYAEDLASTNGTKVNGLATSNHVVHHLDLIEIGRHKLHFFDDALLAGALDDLEHTIVNQYEQTMLAAHVPESRRAPPPRTPARELDRTLAIPRPPADFSPAMHEASAVVHNQAAALHEVSAPLHEASAPLHEASEPLHAVAPAAHDDVHGKSPFALRVVAGPGAGGIVALDRPNTMIGRLGRDTALVIRRGHSFFIARLAGHRPLRLNRVDLGPGTHPIGERDVIDVGSNTFEVIVAT